MADPINTRNVIIQSSMVEKIQQVQQQQGDLHQRSMAHPGLDELERRTREVQDANESDEAKIREKKESEERRERKRKLLSGEEEEIDSEEDGNDDEPGRLVDIKV